MTQPRDPLQQINYPEQCLSVPARPRLAIVA